MRRRVEHAVATMRAIVASLDHEQPTGVDAARLVELFSEAERLCQAGRAVAAKQVLRTKVWRAAGFRTPGQWMAARTQTTLGQAISAVETAYRLSGCPSTKEAFVSGRLSEQQAAAITSAVVADPAAEQGLLQIAERETVASLRDRCREVRAAAISDEDSIERIRRGRFLRHWTDRDGALRLDGRFAPDDGSKLITAILARAARLQSEARRSAQREPADAYAADAIVALAGGATEPKAVVHVHVDDAALVRGRTEPGERAAIEGVGPISVSAARRLAREGIVKVVATDGADVTAVAHLGRTIPARIRTALETRDPHCVVPGCDVRTGLEIDHIVPVALGGPTAMNNLARLCRYHHAQKTHHGWRLGGAPGAWTWIRDRREHHVGRPPPPRAP